MYFYRKILRNECGLNASTASASTQTAFFSISPSLESKATETEYDSSKEEHALRLMEAESLVAQLRAENLAQKNEVREYSGMHVRSPFRARYQFASNRDKFEKLSSVPSSWK